MPAIRRAKLREDAAEVAKHFSNPPLFIRRLKAFFTIYADRTKRPGHTVTPPPLIPAYNAPQPVQREISRVLEGALTDNVDNALLILDLMWREDLFEFKILAAKMLGRIDPKNAEEIFERLIPWSENNQEDRLFDILFETGTRTIRKKYLREWMEYIRRWLRSGETQKQINGLRALIPLIQDPSSDNLPRVFSLLTLFSYEIPPETKVFFRNVLQSLALKSPMETAYFLEAGLKTSNDPNMGWIARQVMEILPEVSRDRVREAAKGVR